MFGSYKLELILSSKLFYLDLKFEACDFKIDFYI